jgi:pimeloyl-ACP methyl ester carboxylesterase
LPAETLDAFERILSVRRAIHMIVSIVIVLAALVATGAVVTAFGTPRIESQNPAGGRMVDVTGGRMHVVELGTPKMGEPAIVMVHGASGNLEDMRQLGELLRRHRVILVDRPGHGYSDRPDGAADASPARQAALISQALTGMGVTRVILVGHSLAGAVVTAFALAEPQRVAGLVLLAPVTHPWPGGIAWYYTLTATPLVGDVFAYAIAPPLGAILLPKVVESVFAPKPAPPDYADRTHASLILRPSQFIANAQDVSGLKDFVTQQAPRYGELKMPVAIFSGDSDDVVSVNIHSRAFAKQVPQTKLTVLPGVGHMPHYAAPKLIADTVDKMARGN